VALEVVVVMALAAAVQVALVVVAGDQPHPVLAALAA
jgi:hypothetical protein